MESRTVFSVSLTSAAHPACECGRGPLSFYCPHTALRDAEFGAPEVLTSNPRWNRPKTFVTVSGSSGEDLFVVASADSATMEACCRHGDSLLVHRMCPRQHVPWGISVRNLKRCPGGHFCPEAARARRDALSSRAILPPGLRSPGHVLQAVTGPRAAGPTLCPVGTVPVAPEAPAEVAAQIPILVQALSCRHAWSAPDSRRLVPCPAGSLCPGSAGGSPDLEDNTAVACPRGHPCLSPPPAHYRARPVATTCCCRKCQRRVHSMPRWQLRPDTCMVSCRRAPERTFLRRSDRGTCVGATVRTLFEHRFGQCLCRRGFQFLTPTSRGTGRSTFDKRPSSTRDVPHGGAHGRRPVRRRGGSRCSRPSLPRHDAPGRISRTTDTVTATATRPQPRMQRP